jgi:hypothetical protein
MNSNNREENKLRNDLHELENGTASQDLFRLAQARNKALSQSSHAKKRYFWPALGTSLASVTLITLLLNPAQESPITGNISITDIEIDETLELYNDLDFYDWLASAET